MPSFRQPPHSGQKVQDWIRDELGDRDVATSRERAREIRRINQERYLASLNRRQLPTRVS